MLSLALLDTVPTYTMFAKTNSSLASVYWHWFFLSQPEPFPERLIGSDPDFFYETCLVGWGATQISDFDPEMIEAYRRAWRQPEMIHGSCYRAAAKVDLDHDAADLDRKVICPTLVLYGEGGVMAQLFDLPEEWRGRCEQVTAAALPGGHFFVDQLPNETAAILHAFLGGASVASSE